MPRKNKTIKLYNVWIEIEEHNLETDQHQTLDVPGAALNCFDSYKAALTFAEGITQLFGPNKSRIPPIINF